MKAFGKFEGKKKLDNILSFERVRVIDTDGEQIGIMEPKNALSIAQEKGLDLVEVAPQADPPVVRIIDYGKYKYRQSKREKARKRSQRSEKTKQIKLGPSTAEHDYEFKMEHGREFLESGANTLFTIVFRGRQLSHPELGKRILERLADDLKDVGAVVSPPQLKGYNMSMILGPKSEI